MYRKYINIVEAANKGCPIATVYQLGRSGLGTVSDTLTLAIAAKNANKNAVATMTWIEQR